MIDEDGDDDMADIGANQITVYTTIVQCIKCSSSGLPELQLSNNQALLFQFCHQLTSTHNRTIARMAPLTGPL